MIKELENAIVDRIKSADLGIEVRQLGTDIHKIFEEMRIWPAVYVQYTAGTDIPLTANSYKMEREFVLLLAAKSLRGASEARQKGIYDLLDNLRSLFAGVSLGVEGCDIVHPASDRPLILEKNRIIWALNIKVIGKWEVR